MSTDVETHRDAAAVPRRLADRFDLPDLFRWWDSWRSSAFEGAIRIEEEMEGETLHIRAEAPGIDPDKDAEVSVQDGMLRIKVERRKEERTEGKDGYRTEFRYGSSYRSVPLPKGVDASQVVATYRDGILDVAVPYPAAAPGDDVKKVTVARG